MHLLKLYLCCYLQCHIISYTLLGRVKNILSKKKKGLKNVILPETLSILCNIVEINIFLQYLSKTARESFENIERFEIFHKFVFSVTHEFIRQSN